MYKILLYSLLLVSLNLVSCEAQEVINFPRTDLSQAALIPMPQKITATYSGYALPLNTKIEIKAKDIAWGKLGNFLAEKIAMRTNPNTENNPRQGKLVGKIILEQKTLSDPNFEAYELEINSKTVTIRSATAVGAFRGIQSFLQLIPERTNDTLASEPIFVIPSGTIIDAPQFKHRGMMLDVARHFFTVEEVKRLIDILAYYKYNTLHLHLSDDQGWRIEIKAWPKLTQVGGASEVGGGTGGFFTQEDFKDIVAYAQSHYIQIIPEIDMPGHTNAASLSYPSLNGNGKTINRYTGMKVGFSTLNTRKESVYNFLDDVIGEICAISPSPYFHIGGDESHVTKKSDYIYFVNRVQKIVQKHGKKMIGWNEVAQANLDPSSVVQFWRSAEQTKSAAARGCKVIMSPGKKAYLDMKYSKSSKYGLTWAGYITLATAYNWYPETYISGLSKSSILGVEAPLWSETIENTKGMDYLAFPRALAYAELGWSTQDRRRWDSFKKRLAGQTAYFERNEIQFYRSPSINWGR